jgi:hypothetical protein
MKLFAWIKGLGRRGSNAPPPAEMPSDELLDQWVQEARRVHTTSGYHINAFTTMARLAIAWARQQQAQSPQLPPPGADPVATKDDCVWHFDLHLFRSDYLSREVSTMTPLPLPPQPLAWLIHAADAGQRDAQALLHLLDRAARPATPHALEPGEVAKAVQWLLSMRELAGEHNPEERRQFTRAATLLQQQEAELAALRGAKDLPAAPTPPPIALVEVVGNELPLLLDGKVDEARTRAAIHKIAAWLDTRGQHGCSVLLREEIER